MCRKIKLVKPSELNMEGLYKFEKWSGLEKFENGKYSGLYKVSNLGRVFSVKNNKVLKPQINNKDKSKGYLAVLLYKNGKPQYVTVHRLVATEFIPNPSDKPCIDHIDTDRRNNKVENLRWVTYQENMNNEISLAEKTNNKFMVIPYCILDDGEKLPLALFKGLSQAEREIQSYSKNVSVQGIQNVLSPRYSKSCGKIAITQDTSDEMLALISLYNLTGKKINWCYIQDWREINRKTPTML